MPRKEQRNLSQITRRTVLRGAGVSLALPWMESLAPAAAGSQPAFPMRFGVLFMGNGINEDHWHAEGRGAEMQLSKTLSILEPIKHKVNIIDGLFNKASTGQGIHPAQTGALLSGAQIQKGAVIRSGVSVDQVIASHVGEDTPQQSLVLSCEQPMTGYHETNFSLAYSSHISWRSPDSPVPVEVYPSLAFDNLFENRSSLRNMSVLDRVKDRTVELNGKIGAADRPKLDEYLTSVREVEQRVETMRKNLEKAEDRAKQTNRPLFTMERPVDGLPEDLRDHARLMCDIIAMAFQTDRTRVATLLLARDLSAQYYPFLNVSRGHHAASHDNLSDGYERVSRFHLSQLAYLAQKLDSMPEGDGTVLDNSCLMWLSNMWIGRTHDNSRLPVVLAGGLGGALETGRTLNYLDSGDDNRKMCSLYLSLMQRMGVEADSFGDAETPLTDL